MFSFVTDVGRGNPAVKLQTNTKSVVIKKILTREARVKLLLSNSNSLLRPSV
jgi:hypothetical protein